MQNPTKKWGFYKSSSNDISANKSCRHILEPSLEALSIALNTLFSENYLLTSDTRYWFLKFYVFLKKNQQNIFLSKIYVTWIFSLSRGTPYPKFCQRTSKLLNEARFVFLSYLDQKLWIKPELIKCIWGQNLQIVPPNANQKNFCRSIFHFFSTIVTTVRATLRISAYLLLQIGSFFWSFRKCTKKSILDRFSCIFPYREVIGEIH